MLKGVALVVALAAVAPAPASDGWQFKKTENEVRLEEHASNPASGFGILFYCLPVGGNSLRQAILSLPLSDNHEFEPGELVSVYVDGKPLLRAVAQSSQAATSLLASFDLDQLAKELDDGVAPFVFEVEGYATVSMTIGSSGFRSSFAQFRSACEAQLAPAQ